MSNESDRRKRLAELAFQAAQVPKTRKGWVDSGRTEPALEPAPATRAEWSALEKDL